MKRLGSALLENIVSKFLPCKEPVLRHPSKVCTPIQPTKRGTLVSTAVVNSEIYRSVVSRPRICGVSTRSVIAAKYSIQYSWNTYTIKDNNSSSCIESLCGITCYARRSFTTPRVHSHESNIKIRSCSTNIRPQQCGPYPSLHMWGPKGQVRHSFNCVLPHRTQFTFMVYCSAPLTTSSVFTSTYDWRRYQGQFVWGHAEDPRELRLGKVEILPISTRWIFFVALGFISLLHSAPCSRTFQDSKLFGSIVCYSITLSCLS